MKVASVTTVIADMLRDWLRTEAPTAGEVFGRHQPNAAYLGQSMPGLPAREAAAA